MNLNFACVHILDQLKDLIMQIRESDYSKPTENLSGASIGQHLRHTLEFFICIERGFERGVINYDKRAHDKLIETDKFLALSVIDTIKTFIREQQHNKPMRLEVGYDPTADDSVTIDTNFNRELAYNIEHAIHHMALIKIGIREVATYISLPADFGVAASTIRYKESEESSHQ